MILLNNYDRYEYSAFILNESRISTDDRTRDEMEPDEHEFDPSRIFDDERDYYTGALINITRKILTDDK